MVGVGFGVAMADGSDRADSLKTLSYPPKLARSFAPSANGSVMKSTAAGSKAPGWPQNRDV